MKGNQGIKSRNVVHPSVRVGSGSHSTRPAGVAQIGTSWGNHVSRSGETNYTGERLHNPERDTQFAPFGNEVAARTTCGPGGSREVMKSGVQGQHGGVAGSQRPQGRDILNNE